MFDFALLPGARKALGSYRLPDDLRVLDLDDPRELLEWSLRPTQVVARNLAVTQAWGTEHGTSAPLTTTPSVAGRQ